ncbi:hypothetical protein J3F83DRAFT_724565, partial [Trichoderma novae-zelandiae]
MVSTASRPGLSLFLAASPRQKRGKRRPTRCSTSSQPLRPVPPPLSQPLSIGWTSQRARQKAGNPLPEALLCCRLPCLAWRAIRLVSSSPLRDPFVINVSSSSAGGPLYDLMIPVCSPHCLVWGLILAVFRPIHASEAGPSLSPSQRPPADMFGWRCLDGRSIDACRRSLADEQDLQVHRAMGSCDWCEPGFAGVPVPAERSVLRYFRDLQDCRQGPKKHVFSPPLSVAWIGEQSSWLSVHQHM